MKRSSRITFAVIFVLAGMGCGFAYLALSKQQATSEMAPTDASQSDARTGTIVGDEKPFAPEW